MESCIYSTTLSRLLDAFNYRQRTGGPSRLCRGGFPQRALNKILYPAKSEAVGGYGLAFCSNFFGGQGNRIQWHLQCPDERVNGNTIDE
jgi:hypothetical protein